MRTLHKAIIVFGMILVLVGCGGPVDPPSPTVTSSPTDQPTATASPTIAPSPTLRPTATRLPPTVTPPLPDILPAPLYGLTEEKQLIRVRRDGWTMIPISEKGIPVEVLAQSPENDILYYALEERLYRHTMDGFLTEMIAEMPDIIFGIEVMPMGRGLVVHAGNSIYRIDAEGWVVTPIYEGYPDATSKITLGRHVFYAPDELWEQWVYRVRLSPDGTRIAFAMNGVYLLNVQGGTPHLVIVNNTNLDEVKDGKFRLYSPNSWSPDGMKLLVRVGLWEHSAAEVFDLETNQLTRIQFDEVTGTRCCVTQWINGELIIGYARGGYGWGMAGGLFQADYRTGLTHRIFPLDYTDGEYFWVGNLYAPDDGFLYFVMGSRYQYDDNIEYSDTLYRLDATTRSEPEVLVTLEKSLSFDWHETKYNLMWAEDASGAILFEEDEGVQWIPFDDIPPSDLVDITPLFWGLP